MSAQRCRGTCHKVYAHQRKVHSVSTSTCVDAAVLEQLAGKVLLRWPGSASATTRSHANIVTIEPDILLQVEGDTGEHHNHESRLCDLILLTSEVSIWSTVSDGHLQEQEVQSTLDSPSRTHAPDTHSSLIAVALVCPPLLPGHNKHLQRL